MDQLFRRVQFGSLPPPFPMLANYIRPHLSLGQFDEAGLESIQEYNMLKDLRVNRAGFAGGSNS